MPIDLKNHKDFVQTHPDGVRLHVRLAPKAKKDALGPVHNGRLKVAVTSPPADGRANAHLVRSLSKILKVAKSDIRIIAGETSREKTLLIAGISSDLLKDRLGFTDAN